MAIGTPTARLPLALRNPLTTNTQFPRFPLVRGPMRPTPWRPVAPAVRRQIARRAAGQIAGRIALRAIPLVGVGIAGYEAYRFWNDADGFVSDRLTPQFDHTGTTLGTNYVEFPETKPWPTWRDSPLLSAPGHGDYRVTQNQTGTEHAFDGGSPYRIWMHPYFDLFGGNHRYVYEYMIRTDNFTPGVGFTEATGPMVGPLPQIDPPGERVQSFERPRYGDIELTIYPSGAVAARPATRGRGRGGDTKIRNALATVVWWIFNAFTETQDAIEVLMMATPGNPHPDLPGQFLTWWLTQGGWQHTDYDALIVGLILNEIEDQVIGRLQGHVQRAMRRLGQTAYHMPSGPIFF